MSDQQAIQPVVVSIRFPHKKQEVQLKIAKNASVQLVHDVLQFTPSTKYLTNFDLYLNEKVLSGSELISNITISESLKLVAKFRPYTVREAVRHLFTVRDFIGFASETEDGISQFALSTGTKFSDMPLTSVKEQKANESAANGDDSQEEKPEKSLDMSDEEKKQFDHVVRELLTKSVGVTELLKTRSNVVTPCVRSLALSSFNPVPAFYRTKGHLLYLQVVTLEGETFHITAATSGFYVNKCSSYKFEPTPKDGCPINVSLFDLIATHSKKFADHIQALDEKLGKLETINYARPTTTFLNKPWLVSTTPSINGDYARLQLNELDFSAERNFNDEFQAIKDIPASDFQSRVDSEKLIAKVSHEFTEASVAGAMSIFYEDMVPMNPEAPREEQIYLKDNIFYSFVSDINGTYSNVGGDEAAFAASNQDLHTIKLLHRVNLTEIRFLLTTIIDFAGHRLLAQTPVPGLLNAMGTITKKDATGKESSEDLPSDVTVSYGLEENSGKILENQEFNDAIDSFAKIFHLKEHVTGGAKIKFSGQSKGIIGSDKRKYILDLANSHPFDVEFARQYYDGIPAADRYPHRQTLIRHELIEKWWITKAEQAGADIEKAFESNEFSFNPDAYYAEGIEDPVVEEISKYLSSEVLPHVVRDYAAGNLTAPYDGEHLTQSLHKNGINMRYLGEVISLTEKELLAQIEQHEKKLKEVEKENQDHEAWEKEYLLKIEKLIKERQEKINKYVQAGQEVPKELAENLKLDENEIRKPTKGEPHMVNRDQLYCLLNVSQLEIISRSLKHVLRRYSKELPVSVVPSLISYFFNLLFGVTYNDHPQVEFSDSFYSNGSFSFTKVTRESLVNEITTQAKLRFRFELTNDVFEKFSRSPLALIRSISKKFGIQILNKDYFYTKDEFEDFKQSQDKKIRNKLVAPTSTFSPDDLLVIPIIKGGDYQSVVGDDFWNQGAALLGEKQEEGLALLTQALAIKEEVNGSIHSSAAESYLALSTIYHKLGKVSEAAVLCRKACIIYERVFGVDSFEMLRCLTNLAILEIGNESPYNAAVVLQRIVNTLDTVCPADHPAVVNAHTMIQQLAMATKDVKLTIDVLKKLSDLILKIDGGERSIAYGYNESRIGNLYATIDDLNSSLKAIIEAREVFTKELGLNDQTTVQCKQWISGIENLIQSKLQQKKLNQQQASVNNAPTHNSKKNSKNSKKGEKPNPEIANKSIDELINFIEGGSAKKTKSKKKSNKQ